MRSRCEGCGGWVVETRRCADAFVKPVIGVCAGRLCRGCHPRWAAAGVEGVA